MEIVFSFGLAGNENSGNRKNGRSIRENSLLIETGMKSDYTYCCCYSDKRMTGGCVCAVSQVYLASKYLYRLIFLFGECFLSREKLLFGTVGLILMVYVAGQ
jgi:hypothetical protein